MSKGILFEGVKTYAYLYLITAPFTYLIYKIGKIRPTDDFILVNIFIAISLWVYIKKIQPLIKEKDTNGNILLFLLIATAVLFSIKSSSLSSDIESEVSSIESTVSSMESDLSTLQSEVSSIESTVFSVESDLSTLQEDVSSIKDDLSSLIHR